MRFPTLNRLSPEAPPAEPDVAPAPLPAPSAPPLEPSRKADPAPFEPDWPDDLPLPQPKAVKAVAG